MRKFIVNAIFLTLGAMIAGFAIEGFLVPNNIIDGGILGISIMASYIVKMKIIQPYVSENFILGLFIFFLNLPFILMALKKMGKIFVLRTFFAVLVLSVSVSIFHSKPVTEESLLATVFGGLILGLGVGLVLRFHGAMDGTEIIAIRLNKKLGFSIGEIIMFFNIFIFTAAGFLYGWNQAMYSILTYFIAYKTIDIVVEGVSEAKSVMIISDKAVEIGDNLISSLDVTITYITGEGGYSGADKKIIYCVVPRLEMIKLKELVKTIDANAFVAIEDVHEVDGARIGNRRK